MSTAPEEPVACGGVEGRVLGPASDMMKSVNVQVVEEREMDAREKQSAQSHHDRSPSVRGDITLSADPMWASAPARHSALSPVAAAFAISSWTMCNAVATSCACASADNAQMIKPRLYPLP